MQIDVAKAFDKVHRGALTSFAKHIIQGVAPEAAAFIESMYDGDEVTIIFGSNENYHHEIRDQTG